MLNTLRTLNRYVAMLVGLLFLACAGLVMVDVILRRLGSSLGGTDEISGYVMAIGTAWGMSYALLELAHVRIDFLRTYATQALRAWIDLFALFLLSVVVSLIAFQSWPVLRTTLKNGSTANTPLETPLMLVQIPWFAGWIWFALMAWLLFIVSTWLTLKGEFLRVEKAIGVFAEHESLK